MKKFLSILLVLAMVCSMGLTAFAATPDIIMTYDLSVDGEHDVVVRTGDIITVTYKLSSSETCRPISTQNEILYDHTFFELVPESNKPITNYTTSEQTSISGDKFVFFNTITTYTHTTTPMEIGTFQLEVNATEGESTVRNTDSIALDNKVVPYGVAVNDLRVVIGAVVTFDYQGADGGNDVAEKLVRKDQPVGELPAPTKTENIFAGWFTAVEGGEEVTAETVISEDTTLYARWIQRTYELDVTAPEFENGVYGDEQPAAANVTIANTGNSDASITGVTLGGSNPEAFTLSTTEGVTVPAGETDSTTYTVQPNAGLDAGTYSAAIIVSFNGKEVTADVTFTVEAASQTAPAAPTLAERTADSVTLTEIPANENGAAAEYRVNGGEWQTSPVFTDLEAGTAYTFEARYGATDNFEASEPSEPVQINTEENVYTVTLNTNGGTINAGDVTEYTYGTGATLPTDVTKAGYTFLGWFSSEALEGEAVTAIGTAESGDKTYYAKWDLNAPVIESYEGYTGAYDNAAHEVGVTASHELELTYAVYKDDAAEPVFTTAKFNVKDVADSGSYRVVVTVTDGVQTKTAEQVIEVSITIQEITLNLDGITLEDKDYDGEPLTYTGEATGTDADGNPYPGDFTYEWYQNGEKLDEAPTEVGDYQLKVSTSTPGYTGSAELSVSIGVPAVVLTVTGEEQTDIFAETTTFTVSASSCYNTAIFQLTFEVDPSLIDNLQVQVPEGFLLMANVYENGKLTVIVGNVEGITGAADLLTITGEPVGGGEATLAITKAKVTRYLPGDNETFVPVDLTNASWTVSIRANIYDVNRDGVVNLLDVTRAQRFYGEDEEIADVNFDGIVNIADLVLILNHFDK